MDVTVTLLEWLRINGPLTLGLVAFVCALGVPLPVPALVIAGGALVRQGQMDLLAAVAFTAAGALAGEVVYYTAGRKLGPLARTRAGARFSAVYGEAENRFRQRPGLSVYLTRWLFAPIGIPTALIAGSSRFPLPRFIAAAVAGNTMWIIGYAAVGYALGNEWHNMSPVFDRYKVYFAAAALTIGIAFVAWRKRDATLAFLRRMFQVAAAALTPRKPAPRPAPVEDTPKLPKL